MENWLNEIKKARHTYFTFLFVYTLITTTICLLHYKVTQINALLNFLLIIPSIPFTVSGSYFFYSRSERLPYMNLTSILFVQCNPPLLIKYVVPVVDSMKKINFYTGTEFEYRIKYLLASAYLFNGEAEKAISMFKDICSDHECYINQSNKLTYLSNAIISYLTVGDKENAKLYFMKYRSIMDTLKTNAPLYQIHTLTYKIFDNLLITTPNNSHLILALYHELLPELNKKNFICMEMLVHWQLVQIYKDQNNKEEMMSHLKIMVNDNNCLEISQRARQLMIDMNEEIEPSLEKNFKYCSISIPPVAYTLIVIGAVPLLIYLFDIFYHLLI